MKAALIVLAVASALAGCSTHARPAGDGSAFPRDAYQDIARQDGVRRDAPATTDDREREWSIREFATPRGLVQ